MRKVETAVRLCGPRRVQAGSAGGERVGRFAGLHLFLTAQGGRTVSESTRSVAVDPGEVELADLRAELDGIDDRLLEQVRARIEVCTRIARLKRRHSIPVMQPGRVGAVHEHARTYALDHDMSPQFLRDLYDLLIAETCRVEDLIVEDPPDPI